MRDLAYATARIHELEAKVEQLIEANTHQRGVMTMWRAHAEKMEAEVEQLQEQKNTYENFFHEECDEVERLLLLIRKALNELGVPDEDHPGPIWNAVETLHQAFKGSE